MIKSIFELSRLQAEVAMQQALEKYPHQPRVYGRECPFCESVDFVKYSLEQGHQRYWCRSCHRRFNERSLFACDCSSLGCELKCQDCPQFKVVISFAKERMGELVGLSAEELQRYFKS